MAAASVPLMIGCEEPARNGGAGLPPTAEPGSVPQQTADTGTVVFLGTSLTAGYGLPAEAAFPAIIQEKIDSAGLPFRVANAGVSGETSAGALRRTGWLLRQPFDVLVLETGANDMLRGANLDSTRANIEGIVQQVREARPETEIVLVGMLAPPNLGRDYTERFREMYVDIAREHDLPLVPFLLEGVGGVSSMNLADGIHPNEAGQRRVARNVWEVLEPELRARATSTGTGAV